MKAYEFSTCKTSDGKLVIPDGYIKRIPENTPVRVILTEEEYSTCKRSFGRTP